MRSHLARNVYRRLLAHPLRSPLSTSSTIPSQILRRSSIHVARPAIRRPSRRTFFGVFQKPPRELKEAELEPGYVTLLEFNSNAADNVRPPPTDELLKAFRDFFTYKLEHNRVVNSTQALCALRLLRHLTETRPGEEGLTLRDLRRAQDAVLKPPRRGSLSGHLELSKALYSEIRRRLSSRASSTPQETIPTTGEAGPEDFKLYVTALTQYGASLEAADLLHKYWTRLQEEGRMYKGAKSLWVSVLRGLAREDREEDLLRQLALSERAGVEYMPPVHEIMVSFFAKKDNFEETRRWFEKPIYGKWPPTSEACLVILRFAVRNKRHAWAKDVFEQLCNTNPHKALWDVIFQWAVLAQDKGVEDIKQMIEIMARLNADRDSVRVDITTINGLVQTAIEKKDPLLAERFISLATELGMRPNFATLVLQMENRLAANDLSGAAVPYQSMDNWGSLDEQALPVINKYIRALCDVEQPDTEKILDVIGAIEQRRAFLEPETVVAICRMFLRNDQQYEVIDTLSLHTFQYSIEEREMVRRAFVDYCLDRRISTARVWDGYSLLRQFFPETDLADRVRLMDAFFKRKRADMACHIFGHMRSHGNTSIRPTADVYARCLEGIGRCPDLESLRMIHNMLKMDTTIEMSTQLYNGLMIAYAACDEPHKAIEFWNDITHSTEGPSYNSLSTVFMVCESLPFGDVRARLIWEKLERMEVEVPSSVFDAYCGAIAGQGNLEELKGLIQGSNGSPGHPPSWSTLGYAYNALPGQQLKEDFETWAKAEYPLHWERLLKMKRKTTIDGLDKFELARNLHA